jgi:hypothetical protein
MLRRQRHVSTLLGKNVTEKHEMIYNAIEERIGKTVPCRFGHVRGSKTGVKHEGPRDVPIREFELRQCTIDAEGNIHIGGTGLQGFCKACSKRRRTVRLETSRTQNKGGHETYRRVYGKTTKTCSQCKEEKDVETHFTLSPGMECGIHNMCKACTATHGDSVGTRYIRYRPDGNFRYKKTEKGQHDDHIVPLAFGGTNEEVNHQLISARANLTKSSTVPFDTVHDIRTELLCERWRPILLRCQMEHVSMTVFKSRIRQAMLDEQKALRALTDDALEQVFVEYNRKNNRRFNTKRCVRLFRNAFG